MSHQILDDFVKTYQSRHSSKKILVINLQRKNTISRVSKVRLTLEPMTNPTSPKRIKIKEFMTNEEMLLPPPTRLAQSHS